MRIGIGVLIAISLSAVWASAQTPRDMATDDAVRFAAFDVVVDAADSRLAAYQIEIVDHSGRSMIVGVEGGAHAAFRAPPYYDPAALNGEGRIILGAFTTDADVPIGKTRVARIHMRIDGEQTPDFDVQLIVAADSDGDEVDAMVTFTQATLAPAVETAD